MFGIFKRKNVEAVAIKKLSHLTIKTKHEKYSWSNEIMENSEYLLPWRDFIKWYYSRPQSAFFDVYDKRGFTALRREDIISFRVYFS